MMVVRESWKKIFFLISFHATSRSLVLAQKLISTTSNKYIKKKKWNLIYQIPESFFVKERNFLWNFTGKEKRGVSKDN